MSRAHALDVCRILRSKFKSYVKSNLFVVALNALFFVFFYWELTSCVQDPKAGSSNRPAHRASIGNFRELGPAHFRPTKSRVGSARLDSIYVEQSARFGSLSQIQFSGMKLIELPTWMFFFFASFHTASSQRIVEIAAHWTICGGDSLSSALKFLRWTLKQQAVSSSFFSFLSVYFSKAVCTPHLKNS